MGEYYPKDIKALVYRESGSFDLIRVPGEKGGQILASVPLTGKDPFEAICAAGRLLCGEIHKDWAFSSMWEQCSHDIGRQTDAEVLASLNESIGVT